MTNAENPVTEFGKILKKLRKSKGLNQEELATVLGVRKTTISNYETGYSTPASATMRQIADFFGVSLDIILPPKPTVEEPFSPAETKPSLVLQEGGFESLSAYKTVPVYSAYCKDPLQSTVVYSLKLPLPLMGAGDFQGLIVSDDRMDRAGLSVGSIAIIRNQAFADDGDIAAVIVGDEPAFFGRIYHSGTGTTVIAESNNLSHRPLSFTAGDTSVTILGKVVKLIQSV